MKCPFCGKEFVPNTPRQKFCSVKCCNNNSARFGRFEKKRDATCRICGKQFTPKIATEFFCSPECRKEATRRREKKYRVQKCAQQRAKTVVDKAVKRPIKTLDDWCREAAACGLDYGNYRALIAQGKTFEQIKAENHQQTAHAHGRLHYHDKL